MTTDVAEPIQREANVGRNALLSAAQVDELAKRCSKVRAGVERQRGMRNSRDDFLRLILSLRSVTNYTYPISIAFMPRRFHASAKYLLPDALAQKILTLRVFSTR